MKTLIYIATLVLVLSSSVGVVAEDAANKPCSDERARQFDFWVGEWTVSTETKDAGRKIAGHSKISSIHNGCTLLEEYSAENSGYEGKSFNYFDAGEDKWHQVWVDNSGLRLSLVGELADGKMIMSGHRVAAADTVTDRITWHNNADGTVRQVWDVSKDGGKTWTKSFDGLYERKE